MSSEVKPRPYNSPRRQAQAEQTRHAILSAAKRLFEKQGYAGTSIAEIARDADVALKTVYVGFETKAGVLRACGTASSGASAMTFRSRSRSGTSSCLPSRTLSARCA